MAYSKDSKSAAVRAHLDHPVIDGDGHWLEPVPIFLDYLRQVAGPSVADRFVKKQTEAGWYEWSPQERRERRQHRPTWWGEPANTLDRATAMVPASSTSGSTTSGSTSACSTPRSASSTWAIPTRSCAAPARAPSTG